MNLLLHTRTHTHTLCYLKIHEKNDIVWRTVRAIFPEKLSISLQIVLQQISLTKPKKAEAFLSKKRTLGFWAGNSFEIEFAFGGRKSRFLTSFASFGVKTFGK